MYRLGPLADVVRRERGLRTCHGCYFGLIYRCTSCSGDAETGTCSLDDGKSKVRGNPGWFSEVTGNSHIVCPLVREVTSRQRTYVHRLDDCCNTRERAERSWIRDSLSRVSIFAFSKRSLTDVCDDS